MGQLSSHGDRSCSQPAFSSPRHRPHDDILCSACGDGGQRGEIGGQSVYVCVCVCVCASSHERLLRAGVHAWPREPTDPSKTLPASLPTEGMGLFLPLSWAGAGGQGEGVCVCVCVCVCLPVAVSVATPVCFCVDEYLRGGVCMSVYACDCVFKCVSFVWVCMVCNHTFEILCPVPLLVMRSVCASLVWRR